MKTCFAFIRLAILSVPVLILAACGSSGGGGRPSGSPTALTYPVTAAVYTLGVAIQENKPTVVGQNLVFEIDSDLPDGLSFNTGTGAITGTPTVAQSATVYTITASNDIGETSAQISITVNDERPRSLTYATTSAVYTKGLPITANTPSITGTATAWSINPALPAGLSLDGTTGVITGTPGKMQAATQYTVTASNQYGSTTATISITVGIAPPSALSYSSTASVYTRTYAIIPNTPTITGTVTSWKIEPDLPGEMSFDDGVITGVPDTDQAPQEYTVTASNPYGSATAKISIAITSEAPKSLTYKTVSAVYTRGTPIQHNTPIVSGTVESYSVSPSLPTGLILNTVTGVISGTPANLQTSTQYTVTATNGFGSTTCQISIIINDEKPKNLTYDCISCSYTRGYPIADNYPTYTGSVDNWSVTPALPAGLTLNTATGIISGTPSANQGMTQYTITASNTGGSATAIVMIEVVASAPKGLHYTTQNAIYTRGVMIANTPIYSGTADSWSVTPALPTGLTLDSATGIIYGTPTTDQAATNYTVKATNSFGFASTTISITINYLPPSGLSYQTTSAVYTRGYMAINIPTYTGSVETWSVSPALPAGLTIDSSTGVISGVPSADQSVKNYTITASNSAGSTNATISITINSNPPSALSYSVMAASYHRDIAIAPNTPTWQGLVDSFTISPALPAGLVLNGVTGVISGTPGTLQSPVNYTVTATNIHGSVSATISIAINYKKPEALNYTKVYCLYTQNEVIAPNIPTYTGTVTEWKTEPALPAGLLIDPVTGIISGTPQNIQEPAEYTITASNPAGAERIDLVIAVHQAAPTGLAYATNDAVYTTNNPIIANTPSVNGTVTRWSTDDPLPEGLLLNAATGAISGTPTAIQSKTAYTITAANTWGTDSKTITITVNGNPPDVLSYSITDAVYTKDAVIADNIPTYTGTVSTWSVSSALPAGLAMNPATGVISGTPSALQGKTDYTITATNIWGATSAVISITVNDNPPENLYYSQSFMVYQTGISIAPNTPNVTGTVTHWAISPTLPTGLSFNTSTGAITGTPTVISPETIYTITASNSGGQTTAILRIRVRGYDWYQDAYLKASNAGAFDAFGDSVSISGDTIVVGARYEDSNQTTITNTDGSASTDNSAEGAGAVYVFKCDASGNWYQDAYLKASNADAGDGFGSTVSISGDTIVVGTRYEHSNQTTITNTDGSASADNSASNAGAAYVFKCDASGNWYQDAYLKASNADAGDGFGSSLSISGDTIVVGARYEYSNQTTIINTNGSASADNSAGQSGSAYVFKCDASGNWYQDAYLKASNPEVSDRFGTSASISGDTIVVGALNEDSNQTTITNTNSSASTNNSAIAAGAAYVFKCDASGNWYQDAYLKASNAEAQDRFGESVSISGGTIVVGAMNEYSNQTIITNTDGSASANNSASYAGAVYIFKMN